MAKRTSNRRLVVIAEQLCKHCRKLRDTEFLSFSSTRFVEVKDTLDKKTQIKEVSEQEARVQIG